MSDIELVKFLDDLKITILQGLLILRRAKAGIQTFKDESQDRKLSAVKRNKFSDFDQLRYSSLNIGHVCGW